MRGPFLIEWHLLRRGFRIWLLVRAVFAVALVMTSSGPLENGGLVGLGVVALTIALGLLDVRRVQERVLLGNLGVKLPLLVALLAAASVLGEIMLAVLLP